MEDVLVIVNRSCGLYIIQQAGLLTQRTAEREFYFKFNHHVNQLYGELICCNVEEMLPSVTYTCVYDL